MKLSNILLGIAALACLAACEMKDELTKGSEKTDTGELRLNVQAQMPAAMTRAAVATDDFPVSVTGVAGTATEEVVKEYPSASTLPASIQLPIGDYTVSAHTPGELEKVMDAPYYGGQTMMNIKKDLATEATVKCRMQNSRIRVTYSAEFLAAFTQWTITLHDGQESGVVLTYEEDNVNPADKFVCFGDNVGVVYAEIRATTAKGETVSASYMMVKSESEIKYDDVDSEYFTGGEGLSIHLKPTEYTTGVLPGITIEADITFEEHEDVVEIPVESDGEEEPVTPPASSDEEPSVELPSDRTYTSAQMENGETEEANAVLKAPAGMSSVAVNITTTSDDFLGALEMMNFSNLELIDNPDLASLFEEIGLNIATPKKGDKEYVFPIHEFFSLLSSFSGTHTFQIVLTDVNGKETDGEFIITVE